MSVGYVSIGVVRNVPRCTPNQMKPISLQHIGTGGSLRRLCTSLGSQGLHGHYPGNGSDHPPGMVGGLVLTVVGMIQLVAFDGHQ